MNVEIIRNEESHAAALRRISELWGAPAGSPEGDELDILATLVERYEERLWPIEGVSPNDAVRFAMEQNGYGQSDLAALLGSRSRASEILSGRRRLSLEQMRLLHSKWRIPAELLIGRLEDA